MHMQQTGRKREKCVEESFYAGKVGREGTGRRKVKSSSGTEMVGKLSQLAGSGGGREQ